jgi:hypothetical protein
MNENIGYIKGEICNRDGCCGTIDEHEKEGSCSCHIHPPCGYCTTDAAYCPVCNWEPADDITPIDPEVEKRNREYYQKENERWQAARDLFYNRFNGKEPIPALEMRNEAHTHFTQKIIGVFPIGTETRDSLLPKVKGTFGGRFSRFGTYNFEYIAYTD